jgi:hypothetical protein
MTTIFDDETKAVALMNMACAAAHADRKLAQAFVDAGLMQAVAPDLRPRTTNRRVEVAARKRVEKWMKAAVRQIEEQAASGRLDLSPPPSAIALAGRDIEPEEPETPRQSVERVVRMCCDTLNELGEVPPVFFVLGQDGRGCMLWDAKGHRSRDEVRRFCELAVEAGKTRVPAACRFIRALEVWSAQDSPVRPSKSDQRKEIVSIILWDDHVGLEGEVSTIAIERDAHRKAYAGAVDIMCGRAHGSDMDQIYGST